MSSTTDARYDTSARGPRKGERLSTPDGCPAPARIPDLDWQALGLKVGHEVHYQLLTERKLFCRCPAVLSNCKPDYEVLRHMRPTLSELGEYDGTALMEFKTKKNVHYQLYRDIDCTYEMDDTPPFPINEQALSIALRIGLMLNLNIVDEMHISRKQYLDGSIPTGFQRTAIIGVDGWIMFRGRRLGITQLGLEEDACREVDDVGHEVVFRADRLGFPLVEVVTHADLHTPEEASEAAALIWRILRSSGQVRTGPGSGRQDVNVSITGSTRVEIKGVPNTSLIRRLVAVEAFRQQRLLEIRDELVRRGATRGGMPAVQSCPVPACLARSADCIRAAVDAGATVAAVRLPLFDGLLHETIEPGIEFGYEFSERVRVIACLDQLPNIVYRGRNDSGFSDDDWRKVRDTLGCNPADEVVLVWGSAGDVRTAVNELHLRAVDAVEGVPRETRQPHPDGTTGFERILPGPDRMYPDTDSPPTVIARERLETLRPDLPEPVWETEERLRGLGLAADIARELSVSPRRGEFEEQARLGVEPKLAAVALLEWPRRLRREGGCAERLTGVVMAELFRAWRDGRFTREGFYCAMRELAGGAQLAELLARPEPVLSGTGLERAVASATAGLPAPTFAREPEAKLRFYMGLLMRRFRGRAHGREVAQVARRLLNL